MKDKVKPKVVPKPTPKPAPKPEPRIPVDPPPPPPCEDDEGSCAKDYPNLPSCDNYSYSSLDSACSGIGVDPRSKSIVEAPADSCPGGTHYNIPAHLTNNKKFYSVICCPCCVDRDIFNGIFEAFESSGCNRQ